MLNEGIERGGHALAEMLLVLRFCVVLSVVQLFRPLRLLLLVILSINVRTDVDAGQFAVLVIDNDADQRIRARPHVSTKTDTGTRTLTKRKRTTALHLRWGIAGFISTNFPTFYRRIEIFIHALICALFTRGIYSDWCGGRRDGICTHTSHHRIGVIILTPPPLWFLVSFKVSLALTIHCFTTYVGLVQVRAHRVSTTE